MKRYLEKVIVPFIERKRNVLKLPPSHPALAIFDLALAAALRTRNESPFSIGLFTDTSIGCNLSVQLAGTITYAMLCVSSSL